MWWEMFKTELIFKVWWETDTGASKQVCSSFSSHSLTGFLHWWNTTGVHICLLLKHVLVSVLFQVISLCSLFSILSRNVDSDDCMWQSTKQFSSPPLCSVVTSSSYQDHDTHTSKQHIISDKHMWIRRTVIDEIMLTSPNIADRSYM